MCRSGLRGEVAHFDFVDQSGKVIVCQGQADHRQHIREIQAANLKQIAVPDEFILGRVLARNIVDQATGEIVANANDEITKPCSPSCVKLAFRLWRLCTPTNLTAVPSSPARCVPTKRHHARLRVLPSIA